MAKMIGENPIKTNKAKAEDQIIIYYATNAAAARCGASVAPYAPGYSWWATNNTSIQITSFIWTQLWLASLMVEYWQIVFWLGV